MRFFGVGDCEIAVCGQGSDRAEFAQTNHCSVRISPTTTTAANQAPNHVLCTPRPTYPTLVP